MTFEGKYVLKIKSIIIMMFSFVNMAIASLRKK
jgi:hypothetical protein